MSGPRARLSLLDRAWAEIVGPRGGQATETGSRGSGRARFGVWRGAVVLSLRPLSIDQRDGSYLTWACLGAQLAISVNNWALLKFVWVAKASRRQALNLQVLDFVDLVGLRLRI